MSLITCKNLNVGYDGVSIVKDLNFEVNSGDYLCIVGDNGSGKTTLMKTLLNLMPAISGEIILGEGLVRNEIGYLPQQTVVQRDFPASVTEIVLSGCLNKCGARPFYTKAQKQLALENMEKLDILHLKNACYHELSGGQQQRVLLARALCATKKILLLDEPVASLDHKVTAEMYRLIKHLNKEYKLTVIMISHDMDATTKYASHILHICHKPLFFGKAEDYLKSNVHCEFAEGDEENA